MNDPARRAALGMAMRLSLMTEAANSVALSHEPDCACVACRAADGDVNAQALVMEELDQEADRG